MPNISRSKDNQTMKLDQLTEYNIINIFLEKSFTKCGGEVSPKPFYKNHSQNVVEKPVPNPLINISGSTVWNVIKFVFIVCTICGLPKHTKTKVLTTCFYLI